MLLHISDTRSTALAMRDEVNDCRMMRSRRATAFEEKGIAFRFRYSNNMTLGTIMRNDATP